jgi:hypothetical protein
MFTDGGSIPRLVRWVGQLDPWEYTPAYLLHDWLFELHHCDYAAGKTSEFSFDDANHVLMEGVRTMDAMGLAPASDLTFALINIAVTSFVAKKIWDADVKVCTLPPDMTVG